MALENREDFGFGQIEAESFQGDFEFVKVNLLVFVEIEEVELFVASGKKSTYIWSITELGRFGRKFLPPL